MLGTIVLYAVLKNINKAHQAKLLPHQESPAFEWVNLQRLRERQPHMKTVHWKPQIEGNLMPLGAVQLPWVKKWKTLP